MMGKQTQAETKRTNLQLLFCVALLSAALHVVDTYKTSTVLQTKATGVKLSPKENTRSIIRASPFQLLPHAPLVQHHFQSDEAHSLSDIAALPDVSLNCSKSDLLVRVKPAFYGLGADASELRLGSMCQSNGVHETFGDLLFKYPLTACNSEFELMPGYLVYKFVLQYDPSSKRFPSKANPVTVNIECRYPRNYHMRQLAIQPTWETHIIHKKLKASPTNFKIQLMDDTWKNPVDSWVFHLGETVNFKVSALHLYPGQKLYINSCYATPVTHPKSHIKFTIIDNYGCLLDSKTDPGASKFISRTDDSVRFSLKAFQFVTDPSAEISMHCQLYVTTAGPSHSHKSCTYIIDSWEALSGDHAVCECCDSQCVTSKRHRAMMDGIISSGSSWVSSHSDPSYSRGNPRDERKTHAELMHPGEIDIVKHQEEIPGVTDLKSVKEPKWKTHEHESVNIVESDGNIFDSKQQNYTTEQAEYQRLKPEDAELLDTDGDGKSQKTPDGIREAELKEVFEQENSGDEVDGKKTWYFSWR